MTPEQQKALALARARKRRAEADQQRGPDGMTPADRIAAVRAGTMPQPSQDRLAATAEADAMASTAIRDSMGVGQKIRDNVVGTNDGVQSTGEALGTWLNRAGETMTLGTVGDEASAAAYSMLPGRTYEGELDRFRQNEAGMSTAGRLTADITGAVLPAFAGFGLASKAATLPAAVTRGAAIGGGQGATMGFMEGEGGLQNRAADSMASAGLGAALGGIFAPAAGALTDKVVQGRANRAAIAEMIKDAPSSDDLRTAGNAAYRAIDDANVQIKPEAFNSARQRIAEALRANTGFDELPGPGSLTPNTARTMEIMGQSAARMADDPTAALPFKSLDQMRRQAGAAAGNVTNKTDARAGVEVIQGLDDFVNNLSPDDVVSGDVAALQTMIPKAREIWSRMTKSQLVDDAIESGSNNYMGGAGSGIRNQFASILRNKKLSRGFNDLELAAMRKVVNGSIPEQFINLMGGGLGQLATMGGGLGLGGIPGFLAGSAVAAGARKASEAVVGRNAETARALIASGRAGALPQISQQPRAVIEALIRRSGEMGRQ
jgi:hypothetical protein